MFSMGNRLYMVFGDCYGAGFTPPPDGNSNAFDHRGNTLAVIADRTPADGLAIERMIADQPGHAKALLPPGKVPKVTEAALIPTNGIAVGSRMVLHYMSVRSWDGPGRWTLNGAGLATSEDQGETWTKNTTVVWPGNSGFGQVAFVKSGKTVYLFGIPGGRFGDVKLAQVPEKKLLVSSAYRYFGGMSGKKPLWLPVEAGSVPVTSGPAGELSVMWSPFLKRWLMTYLSEPGRALVIRDAPELWGPWTAPKVLATTKEYPAAYGAYMHPWLTEKNGEIIYFTMSRWLDYNVFLMKARLVKAEG
jgi:hypothetical protein